MRFLFIYQDYAEQARKLLDDLKVRDVVLIIARKKSSTPTPDEIKLLEAHRGAHAAACEINRGYRKSVDEFVSLSCEPKKFRFEDQQLRAWLAPINRAPVTYKEPSVTFLAMAAQTPRLILHPDALQSADMLVEHRWEFVAQAASLLARYANGEPLGAFRDWKSIHGIEFAANGRVAYKYDAKHGTDVRSNIRTEWHLKQGDKTTRESAARIYFEPMNFVDGAWVVVFYVGPHPQDGVRKITIVVPS